MNQYLFIFTIGPVQSFIAQARKTQDLYIGSQILSELIQFAMREAKQHFDTYLPIFPSVLSSSNPNRFLAEIGGTKKEIGEIGLSVESKVKEHFLDLAEKLIPKKHKQNVALLKAFEQQVNQHLEIFWLFEEIRNGDYKTAYVNIERNLGAIKNVRSFQQFDYNGIGERGRKCSLDGERNALFFGKGTNPHYFTSSKWNPEAIELKGVSNSKVGKNEGLSAVGFTKRFYKKGGFPSTAKIALMESLHKITGDSKSDFEKVFGENNLLYQLEKEKCLKLNGKEWMGWDDQFYYEENLIEKYIPCKQQLEIAKKQHKKLVKAFKDQNLRFDKYYAVLTFDGDDMGKWLSGDQDPNVNLKDFHIELSKCLSGFAANAKIKAPNGREVYSGGDDFLGFVNLNHLFDVLKELRSQFDEKVNQVLKSKFSLTLDLTFSAGVAIAHYKTPLNIVLDKSRKMQEMAKESSPSKNALGIAVLKHSGDSNEAVVKWGQIDNIEYLVEELKNVSDSFSRDLQQEFATFEDEFIYTHDEIVKVEIKRLIQRKKLKRTFESREEKNQYLVEFVNNSADLFDYEKRRFGNFKQALSISQFLNKEINIQS
ncbi:MAG: type III-B CRISPR-associated protein Cas10/Cmr2 [Chitinophagales bacterium]